MSSTPPSLPASHSRLKRLPLLGLLVALALVGSGFFLLRATGRIRAFSVPTNGMAPAVSAGDYVMMEGATFLARAPCRGEIIVFKTDGIAFLEPGSIYVERVAGLPGEHVRLTDGELFINDKLVPLSNSQGNIAYRLPLSTSGRAPHTDIVVPEDLYFVLGDNSEHSSDSRFWGCVPRKNILGRVAFCYWPPQRAGAVH